MMAMMFGGLLWALVVAQAAPRGEPPAARVEEPVDLTPFEREVLPLWLDRFALDFGAGHFAFEAGDRAPSLYGVVDAAHLLASTGALDELLDDDATRDAWKTAIDSHQFTDGSYHVPKGSPGWQPWHASASASAALALLRRAPRRANAYCAALAARGEVAWRKEFDPLYFSACESAGLGGNNIHKCGQRIGSCPAVLGAAAGNATAFLTWWPTWLAEKTDPARGVLCPPGLDEIQCVGGAMPTHGVLLGFDPAARLPDAPRLLDFALRLQTADGAWSDAGPDVLGSLTLDGAVQVTRAALQLQGAYRWDDARRACRRTLELSAKRLNDAAFVLANYSATSHGLPNVVAAAAECAQTFPDDVRTDRPWRCCARYV